MGIAWSASSDDVSGAGPAPGEAPTTEAPAAPEALRFVSSQLTAPRTEVWRRDGAAVAAGLLFTTPRTPTFRGVVYDDEAQPVWIEPDGSAATDLRVQTYRGRPVLTYWTGEIKEGTGNGKGVVLDERYLPVAEVRCGHGVLADIHEFQLTSRGTALLTSYPTLPYDLSPSVGRWTASSGRAAAGGGRGDRRGAARLGGPRPHRPHRDLPRGRRHGTAAPALRPHPRQLHRGGRRRAADLRPAHQCALPHRPAYRRGALALRREEERHRGPGGRRVRVAARPASPARRHDHDLRQPRQRHRDRRGVRGPALRAGRGDDDRHPRAGAAVPGPLRLRDGQRPAPRRRARARRVGDGSLRHRVRRRRARRSSSCPGSGSAPTGPTASRGAVAR